MSDEIIVVITESIDQLVSIHKEGIERLQELRATCLSTGLRLAIIKEPIKSRALIFVQGLIGNFLKLGMAILLAY